MEICVCLLQNIPHENQVCWPVLAVLAWRLIFCFSWRATGPASPDSTRPGRCCAGRLNFSRSRSPPRRWELQSAGIRSLILLHIRVYTLARKYKSDTNQWDCYWRIEKWSNSTVECDYFSFLFVFFADKGANQQALLAFTLQHSFKPSSNLLVSRPIDILNMYTDSFSDPLLSLTFISLIWNCEKWRAPSC